MYKRIGRLLEKHAGIAQLVEQATENRRVPSSNLGPGTFKPCKRQGFLVFLELSYIFINTFKKTKSRNFSDYCKKLEKSNIFADQV